MLKGTLAYYLNILTKLSFDDLMKIEKLFNKPVDPIFIRIISELRVPCWII